MTSEDLTRQAPFGALQSLGNTTRAALVALGWALGAAPAIFGAAQCPSARFLHVPCPGCGMTRAAWLFLRGDVRASFAMHPLAVPIAFATFAVACASLAATFARGTPWAVVEWRAGKWLIAGFVALQIASVVLWGARAFGLFGGPVPLV